MHEHLVPVGQQHIPSGCLNTFPDILLYTYLVSFKNES